MLYKLRKVRIKNIRSISEAEITIDSPIGLYRVGGRNGQGKSTGFNIGMSALLGLTAPLPLVTHGMEEAVYEIENGYGRFGFRVDKRKVTYYYSLCTGEEDSSSMTINNNICIDVIRAYTGFNIDTEFKSVLNLNSKDFLNFVVTNGRSELGFLKDLVYSEEIEKLQTLAIEREKTFKSELDRVSDKIQFASNELYSIHTVDEEWLKQAIYWAHSAEDVIIQSNKIKLEMIGLHVMKLNYLKTLRDTISLRSKVLLIESENITRARMELDLSNLKLIKHEMSGLIGRLDKVKQLKGLVQTLETLKQFVPTLEARESINELSSQIKNLRVTAIQNSMESLIENKHTISRFTTVYQYYNIEGKKKEILITKIAKESFYNSQITLKKYNSNQLELKRDLLYSSKAILKSFSNQTVSYKKNFLQNLRMHFQGLGEIINKYQTNKKLLGEIKTQLDEEIYKDGRCILCYSKKSIETE